jgi:Rieske [2Fe-2S] domain
VCVGPGAEGKVSGLVDRCCHRGAPLSLEKVTPEGLQCGYHAWCSTALANASRSGVSADGGSGRSRGIPTRARRALAVAPGSSDFGFARNLRHERLIATRRPEPRMRHGPQVARIKLSGFSHAIARDGEVKAAHVGQLVQLLHVLKVDNLAKLEPIRPRAAGQCSHLFDVRRCRQLMGSGRSRSRINQ